MEGQLFGLRGEWDIKGSRQDEKDFPLFKGTVFELQAQAAIHLNRMFSSIC